MAYATLHAYTEHRFTYSHGIHGTVKIKVNCRNPLTSLRASLMVRKLTSPKTSLVFAVGLILQCSIHKQICPQVSSEGLGGNLSLGMVEHNTAVTSKQCHRTDLRNFAL